VLLKRGSLGEVTRAANGFTAEFRGLAHRLGQPSGRIFQFGCDAELGDQRCGVNLADPDFSAEALIVAARGGRFFTLTGIDDFEPGFFARGRLRFLAGANEGRVGLVKLHREGEIELWQPMAGPVLPGEAVRLTAGCDKQFGTCRNRFMNAANFRGFPHMPGDDFVLRQASREGQ
jgi:uncharacterized phage protein (TIGR02218 family)